MTLREAIEALSGQCHDGEGLGCETFPCVENVSRADVLALVDREELDVERLAWAIRSLYGGTPPTAHQQAKAIAEAYAALVPSQEAAR